MDGNRNKSEKVKRILIRMLLVFLCLAVFGLLIFTGISIMTDSFIGGTLLILLSIALLITGLRFLRSSNNFDTYKEEE